MRTVSIIGIIIISLFSNPVISSEKPKAKEEKAKSAKSEHANPAEMDKPKIYFKLEPSLVLNVEEKDVTRFLQVDAQLQYTDPLAQPIIEKHMPAIRDAMIMVISGAEVTKIKTSQGKENLRKVTLAELQKVMTEITGEPVIDDIFFTGFIIQ